METLNITTPTPTPSTVKLAKLVPHSATVAIATEHGYKVLSPDTKTSGNWADMVGKVLKGSKTHMQVFLPMFEHINGERKFGLHKNTNVAGEVAQLANVFGGVAMVNDSFTPKQGGARYIVVAIASSALPVVERRTLQGDKAKASYKANVAEYKAKASK